MKETEWKPFKPGTCLNCFEHPIMVNKGGLCRDCWERINERIQRLKKFSK